MEPAVKSEGNPCELDRSPVDRELCRLVNILSDGCQHQSSVRRSFLLCSTEAVECCKTGNVIYLPTRAGLVLLSLTLCRMDNGRGKR
jgi:hypothetical protein